MEFTMTQQEMDNIIAINNNRTPVMKIGNYWSGLDMQERINAYWKILGKKYGFDPFSVSGQGSSGELSFIAEKL
jgi:hypothetical protein